MLKKNQIKVACEIAFMLRDIRCGGICVCECVLVYRVCVCVLLCLCGCGLCSWWPNWWTMWHKMVASSIEQPSPHVPPHTCFSYETDWGSRACHLHTWAGQWAGHYWLYARRNRGANTSVRACSTHHNSQGSDLLE